MAEHMKQSQIELNELLTEYWKLRYSTGVCCVFRACIFQPSKLLMPASRGVYGDVGEQVGDAGHGDVICSTMGMCISCMCMCSVCILYWGVAGANCFGPSDSTMSPMLRPKCTQISGHFDKP